MTIANGIRPGLRTGLRAGLNPGLVGVNNPIRLAVGLLQSNMQGPGDGPSMEALRADVTDPYANVKLWRSGAGNITTPINWVNEGEDGALSLQPRTEFISVNFPIGSAGMELSLGRALDARHPGKWRMLIKSINGSGLNDEWVNPGYPATPPSLLEQAFTDVDAALSMWNAQLSLLVLTGLESDSGESPDHTNVKTNFTTLVQAFWNRYGVCPVVIPRLSYHSGAGGSVSTCISRTMEFEAANRANVRGINTNEETHQVDNVHYSDASLLSLGDRVDAAYAEILAAATPANPYVSAWGIPVTGSSAQGVSPVPPEHQANDILLLCHFGNGNTAYGTPAGGWAHITNSPQHDGGAGANARVSVWWLRATDGATATPTVADVSGDGGKLAVICVIRGCKTSGNPFATSAGATAASGTAVSAPTVDTTGTNNCLVMSFIAATYNATSVAQARGVANTDLTTVQEEFDVFSTASAAGGVVLSGVKATGGAVGATTTTLSNAATQAKLTAAFAPP